MDLKPIPLYSPFIHKDMIKRVTQVLNSKMISEGTVTREFESLFCTMLGYRYALAVNSGTSALRMTLEMAGVHHGQRVISTPFTAVATNMAILEQGAKVDFIDIDYNTLNIDPESIENSIVANTSAIMVVHYAGYPCDMMKINKIGLRNQIPVIEDCAHALGARWFGLPVGRHLGCFSFQTVKHITTGNGGMFATDQQYLYNRAKATHWFGIDKDEREDSPLGKYPKDIWNLGFGYSMNNITAAMGVEGLKHFDGVMRKRQEIAKIYREELASCPFIELPYYDLKNNFHAYWMFPMHVIERTKFAKYMRKNSIEVSNHCYRNDSYTVFGGIQDLPNVERIDQDIIHIPLHQDLLIEDVDYVVKIIKNFK